MKRISIVYYSRTGFTRRIVKEIAGPFDCDIEENTTIRRQVRGFGASQICLSSSNYWYSTPQTHQERPCPVLVSRGAAADG
jgi:hypothetical protein